MNRSVNGEGLRHDRVSPPLGVKRPALVALACAGLVFSVGCSSDEGSQGAHERPANEAVVDGVVGELASVEGELAVGEELSVLVPLPTDQWSVENGDETVAHITEEATGDEVSVVRITALAPGESTVVFQGQGDISDEITVTVSDEPAP